MKPGHEDLFPCGRMLEERLGSRCFEQVPQEPGIYRFYDGEGRLLYVGKAVNLRRRLYCYRRARPGQVSRKVSKLVSRIRRFEVEVLTSDEEAILMENLWIRRERPPFNHVNKAVETYYFIYIRPGERELDVRLSMRVDPELDESHYYGSYKGHGRVRKTLGCLLQLLWICENSPQSPHYLPVQLTRRLTPVRYRLQFRRRDSFLKKRNICSLIHNWLLGESEELTGVLAEETGRFSAVQVFNGSFADQRMETLERFYERMLIPHRRMRESCGEKRRLIGQDELDDLWIVSGRKEGLPSWK